eukprot:PhM_4_TR3009/c1_g2_i9/m.37820
MRPAVVFISIFAFVFLMTLAFSGPNKNNRDKLSRPVWVLNKPTPLFRSRPKAVRGYLGDPKARQVPPPKCKYVFERYEPSPWEAKWAKNIGYYEKNVCASLNGEFKPLVDIYVEHFPKCTINSLATDGKPLPSECPEPTAPVPFDERVFSKYHYRLQCESDEALRASGLPERQVSYIEPLAGMLRRPTVCQDQAYENIINKNYM